MKNIFMLAAVFGTSFVTYANAQNTSLARERIFDADFAGAQSALQGNSPTDEVHILRAIAEAGEWFGTDVNSFLKSLGAKAAAVDRLTDLQTALANEDETWFLEDNWMQGEAPVLTASIEGDFRIFEFLATDDKEPTLVLRNLSTQPLSFSLTLKFSSEMQEFKFFRDGEFWAEADLWDLEIGWDYQQWHDENSVERSFTVTIEPDERLAVVYEMDGIGDDGGSSDAASLSLSNSLITNGSLEIQNGQFDRYNAPRDPINEFFELEMTDESLEEDLPWRADGQIELWDEAQQQVSHDLDYWLSKSEVLFSPEDARSLTLVYSGTTATQVSFTVFSSETYDYWADYEATIYLNGVEVGNFDRHPWGVDWLGQDLPVSFEEDDYYFYGAGGSEPFILSLPLEPGDRLTVTVKGTGWGYYQPNPGGEEEVLVGISFGDPVPTGL